MANSASPTYDAILTSQSNKEKTANAFFDAASQAELYGRRDASTTGLTWGYYGGNILLNGVITQIANGVVALVAGSTNYVEANPADGTVSKNTTGFTPGFWPLYTVVTSASTITSYTDQRLQSVRMTGRLAKTMSDANTTLTQAEAANEILELSGTLTATRNIVLPLVIRQWTVANKTGQSLQFIGASGTGITVATGKRAILYCDGINIVRATADV